MFKLNFDIKKHFLENGLEVLTIKKDTQISAINLGVKVGAMYETKEEKGISHFVEHMLFKGTKTRKNEILNEELENLGGEYNAYTDYESTVYTISCLSEEIENATKLIADMAKNSNFLEEEMKKERGVILAEIRTGKDDIEDLTFKKVNEIAFDKSFLKFDVTGTEENVKNFTRDDIYKFYKKYYTPKNALVTLVSSMEHKDALNMIKDNFSNWSGEKVLKPLIIKEDNILKKVTSYKENIEQSTIIYLYTFYHLNKEEELPLRILNHRLGESSNSLLFREIRENKGLAYDIYTNLEVTKNIKSLYIYTSVADEDIEKTLDAIDEVINKVITKEIKIGQRDL